MSKQLQIVCVLLLAGIFIVQVIGLFVPSLVTGPKIRYNISDASEKSADCVEAENMVVYYHGLVYEDQNNSTYREGLDNWADIAADACQALEVQ